MISAKTLPKSLLREAINIDFGSAERVVRKLSHSRHSLPTGREGHHAGKGEEGMNKQQNKNGSERE